METTEAKTPEQGIDNTRWYYSKTVWCIVLSLATSILKKNGIELPDNMSEILMGAGLIFSRNSVNKLKF